MSFTVVWDDPNVEVRATITSRTEMEELARALANAEKNLLAEEAGKPEKIETKEKSSAS